MHNQDLRRFLQHITLALVVSSLAPTLASAATYYVRPDGNNVNSGLADNASEAWRTIAQCASRIVAGDVCRVQPGTYAEVVTQATSGAAGDYITYVADGSVTNHGWLIRGDYVRIIGFTVEGGHSRSDGFYLQNANYVELWHNTVQNFERDAIRTDSGGRAYQSNNCLFIGNVIIRSAYKDFQVRGHGNLVAYNEARFPETDFLYLFGQRNRVLNNYSHGVNAAATSHTDFVQSGSDSMLGLGNTLIEANIYEDANSPGTVMHHHGSNVQNNAAGLDTNTVLRRNIWSNHGSYSYGFSGTNFTYLKVYHDTAVNAQIDTANSSVNTGVYNQGTNQSYKNNIFVQQWGTNVTTAVFYSAEAGHVSDYNIWFDTGGAISYGGTIGGEAHSQRNTDPLFGDRASLDFTLRLGSPARGTGGALTSVTSASGSGTTFTVADATYFRGDDPTISQYGGNLVVGDTVTVGTDVRNISSISGNTITVTEPLVWINGDPVYFGAGTTPDIGAYPFKPTGYALTATRFESGGIVTVTPSNPDLVRFVVCFENGIPIAVDNSSPYTCAVGSGPVDVRLYPRYAAKTLWVPASSTSSPPASPTNLRIIR